MINLKTDAMFEALMNNDNDFTAAKLLMQYGYNFDKASCTAGNLRYLVLYENEKAINFVLDNVVLDFYPVICINVLECLSYKRLDLIIKRGFKFLSEQDHYYNNMFAQICTIDDFDYKKRIFSNLINFIKYKNIKYNYMQLFYNALQLNSFDVVKIMVDEGFDINTQSKDGCIFPYLLLLKDKLSIIDFLLDNGFYMYGISIMLECLIQKKPHYDVVNLLLSRGFNLNQKDIVIGTKSYHLIPGMLIKDFSYIPEIKYKNKLDVIRFLLEGDKYIDDGIKLIGRISEEHINDIKIQVIDEKILQQDLEDQDCKKLLDYCNAVVAMN